MVCFNAFELVLVVLDHDADSIAHQHAATSVHDSVKHNTHADGRRERPSVVHAVLKNVPWSPQFEYSQHACGRKADASYKVIPPKLLMLCKLLDSVSNVIALYLGDVQDVPCKLLLITFRRHIGSWKSLLFWRKQFAPQLETKRVKVNFSLIVYFPNNDSVNKCEDIRDEKYIYQFFSLFATRRWKLAVFGSDR